MLVGELPFADSNLSVLYDLIVKGKYFVPEELSQGILSLLFTSGAKDIISKLLVVNPKKRYTISQIKDHPWISNGVTLLNVFDEEEIRHIPKDESEIDLDVLEQVEQIGFDRDAIKSAVLEKKYDQLAGAYHIFSYQKQKDASAFAKASKEIEKGPFKLSQKEIPEMAVRGEDETSAALAQLLLKAQRDEEDPLPTKTPKINHTSVTQKQSNKSGIKKPFNSSLDHQPIKPPMSRKTTEETLPNVLPSNKKDTQWQSKHSNLPPIKTNADAKNNGGNTHLTIKKERKLDIDETLYTNETILK